MIDFLEPRWIEYLELWSFAIILSLRSPTTWIHNLPWYINTPSPIFVKSITFCLCTSSFSYSRKGSWYWFSFTSTIRYDSNPFYTTTPPSSESTSWTPNHTNLCTSLASPLFSSLRCIILPIDILLSASTITFVLLDSSWYLYHNLWVTQATFIVSNTTPSDWRRIPALVVGEHINMYHI